MAVEIKDAPWVSQPIVPHGAVDPITLELVKGATRAMQAEMENLPFVIDLVSEVNPFSPEFGQ